MIAEQGPVIAALLLFVWWQARWINKLLERNKEAYEGEIERMSKRETRLLDHILGEQASSLDAPTIEELVERTSQTEMELEAEEGDEER